MRNILRKVFTQEFEVNSVMLDFIHYLEDKYVGVDIDNFIIRYMNESFMYGELFDMFKSQVEDKEQLKKLLEYLDHSYIDLDDMLEEERDSYY